MSSRSATSFLGYIKKRRPYSISPGRHRLSSYNYSELRDPVRHVLITRTAVAMSTAFSAARHGPFRSLAFCCARASIIPWHIQYRFLRPLRYNMAVTVQRALLITGGFLLDFPPSWWGERWFVRACDPLPIMRDWFDINSRDLTFLRD